MGRHGHDLFLQRRLATWTLALSLLGALTPMARAESQSVLFPLVPVVSAFGDEDYCHFSFGYASSGPFSSYGPMMGCQWGSRVAFLLDWGLTPAHATSADVPEETRFGVAAHLSLGMKVTALEQSLAGSFELGWSFFFKGLGGGDYVEEFGWGYQYGGSTGTSLGLAHDLLDSFSLEWTIPLAFVFAQGDMLHASTDGWATDWVHTGLSLTARKKGSESAAFVAYGALIDTSESEAVSQWFGMGVLF